MPTYLTRIKNNQVTDSTIVASAKLVAGSITGGLLSDPISYSGNMTINGNLTVQGTTTVVDTTNTLVADPIIVLSRGETSTPSKDSGLLIERGTSNNAAFLWDETNDRFQAITTTDDGTTAGTVAVTSYADIKFSNLITTGGDITTTSSSANVLIANATTVSFATAATTLNIGAATGTTIVKNNLDVDGNINLDGVSLTTSAATVNIANATTTTLNIGGAATAVNIGTTTGTTIVKNDLQVDGGDLTFGAATTVNIANATVTTLNLGGAATAVNIGAATGTTIVKNNLDVDGNINLDGGSLTTSAATVNIANATTTTLNIAGAATTLEIGSASGTTNINNNLDVDGDINLDGGDFTVSTSTVNIANANATTINFGGAATTLEIGAATGTTNINNNLDVDGNINLDGASLTTSTATVNIANANTTTLNIGGASTTTTIGAATGNVIIGNDLQVNGNDIRSSTGNVAMTLNDINVTITGNLTIQGATTNIGTQDLVVEDSVINLHTTANLAALTSDDGRDIGLKLHYYKTSDKNAFIGWKNDTSALEYYVDATETNGVISGTYGTIKTNVFFSNITTGTAPFIVNSTTQVANLNVATAGTAGTVTTAAQPNITSLGNLTIANIDNIQIDGNTISSTDTNGNIILAPNGTGDVQIDTDTVRIGDSAATATLTTNGAGNLTLSTNEGTNSGTIAITNGANGNITITPNGTGDVVLSSDTVAFGDSNATANITTNGTGNLVLSTNDGTNSGTITVVQGINGNINLTPNGTGEVVASTLAVTDLTTNRVVYVGASDTIIDDANLTFNGSTLTVTGTSNVSGQFNTDNIRIDGNTISSIDVNGNVNLDANGIGDVVVNSSKDNSDFYVYGNSSINANAVVYTKSSTVQVGILTESPATGATLHINAVDSMILPAGATGDRPTGVEGMVRYNTSNKLIEFWNNTAWTSTQGSFTVIAAESFAGDGSTLLFTLSASATTASVIVSINGIVQIPSTAYSVSTTALTFTEAPAAGDEIDVRRLTTTYSVTAIEDLNTGIFVSDSAETANVKIDGDLILSVSNLAILPGTDNLYNIGSGSFRWKNVYATNTNIQSADLAENYLADRLIVPGTVVSFGGSAEVTVSTADMDTKVAGVVSTEPAHLMNSALQGDNVIALALQGRVPCKVTGTISKGDMMVSAGDGRARSEENPRYGSVIGKALEDFDGDDGVIEVVVGRL